VERNNVMGVGCVVGVKERWPGSGIWLRSGGVGGITAHYCHERHTGTLAFFLAICGWQLTAETAGCWLLAAGCWRLCPLLDRAASC
jgi:hypothetical protein